ncbi:M1 family metallopeptidase [Flavobacterium sp.]|uniref:M1 family metallopeptidase n=1 Tax=Flavobacterium sp. TaxID=239 RepID=UPI002486EDCD|nr:M1 family metallopeptidase [Flavobacterium sp.]MDI1317190.1 M1 family metallopeptidase [Flavobacterium sp.]
MRYYLLFFITYISLAQQTAKVDFIKVTGMVAPDASLKKVIGAVTYHFNVLKPIDTIRIEAINMNFDNVKINNKEVKFKNNTKELLLFEGFKKGVNWVSFTYKAYPKQTMYFNGVGDNQQIWTQGQGKYTSHWFPSFDDVNEKVIFNLQIIAPKEFVALSNGILKEKRAIDNDLNFWNYKMENPMSSYLLAIAIGNFVNKTVASKSHVPIQLFIQPRDTAKFEPTYRYSAEMFDYLEKEIGVKYPWKIYKQIPIEDFLYGGMENTSCTLFAQNYVVDEIGFNDKNYVYVNAHELAHQWFGDLVTEKSGTHHWLQEGFATYYGLLAERKVFGDDYFYHKLYRNSLQLRNAALTDTIPVLNEKASSLSFYEKGAWALHVIRETIGAKAFQKAVKSYLKKYQFQNVETDQFLAEIKKVAPKFDILDFKKRWLEDYHFQTDEANALLRKNRFLQTLFETQQLRKKSFAENKEKYKEILESAVFYPVKSEVIFQMKDVPFADKKELLLLALQTKDVKVRQSVAEFTTDIPVEFKANYESLLDDNSYDTKEIVFMNLWKNFPTEKNSYLAKAKNWVGSNDKSLRILYLTFSIENESLDSPIYYKELVEYTSPKYETSIRQNAIVNALMIQAKDETVLKNVVNATTHYKWQFSKFGREKIRELLRKEGYRMLFENLTPTVSEIEKVQLQKLLNEKL